MYQCDSCRYCCRNCRVSRRLSRLTVDGCESVLSISLTLSTLIPHWPWDKTTLFSLVSVSSLRVETFNVISQMSIRCILPYICFHNLLYFDFWFILKRCALDVPRSGEGCRNLASSLTWGYLELRAKICLQSTSLCNETYSLLNMLRDHSLFCSGIKTLFKGMPKRVLGFE